MLDTVLGPRYLAVRKTDSNPCIHGYSSWGKDDDKQINWMYSMPNGGKCYGEKE